MEGQEYDILTNGWLYAGILVVVLITGLSYLAYQNKVIKPKPLKLAELQCSNWVLLQYGKGPKGFEKFLIAFEAFEIRMEYTTKYSELELRTLQQWISPKNKLNEPNFLERVSIFFEAPFLVQGSLATKSI